MVLREKFGSIVFLCTFASKKILLIMKRYFMVLGCLLLAMIASALPVEKNTAMDETGVKIVVISDPHLLAPSLYDEGKAAEHLASSDMKLVLESDLIVGRMVDEIIREKPQFLFIAGDLTFNGACASHERMVSHLERLSRSGVKPLIIPGNHDVKNPYSKSFIGDESKTVATISSEDFAQLYSHFGYGADSERDPNSLSYTCEPIPGLILLAIDSNRYDENGKDKEYHSDGAVKAETLEWMKGQLAKAKAEGKKVIAMMHHHLVEHIDGEARLLPNYVVADHERVAKVLTEGGVKVIFTGHLHITDAATIGGITDVATGSASTYPLPMRTVTVTPNLNALDIDTRFFEGVDEQILQQGKLKVVNSAEALARLMSRQLWPKLSGRMEQLKQMFESQGMNVQKMPQNAQELSNLLLRHFREPLAQSVLSVTRGDENIHDAAMVKDAIKQGVTRMMIELMGEEGEMVAEFLIDEMMPRVEPMLNSALEDLNQVGTDYESQTDDHVLAISL
jgi:3',5'-cyclic AMP phosphodiesterase CpdA